MLHYMEYSYISNSYIHTYICFIIHYNLMQFYTLLSVYCFIYILFVYVFIIYIHICIYFSKENIKKGKKKIMCHN